MGFIKLTFARSVAIIGTLLLCSGIGWLAVLNYEARNAPDWMRYELSPPWMLRVMVFSGIMLLIGAGGSSLYKFLSRRFRH
jgi:uncharacterized membrane protein SirB2